MKTNWMKLSLIGLSIIGTAAQAATISMVGSTTVGGGGDFGDYITGFPVDSNDINTWPASTKSDSTVILSAGEIGLNLVASTADFHNVTNVYRGVGSEINFTQGNTNATAASVITSNTFLSFQLNSTTLGSTSFTLDSISLSLWRNGAAASTNFQLAYDADNNGFTTSDLLGTAVTNSVSGTTNTFTVSSAISSLAGTTQEVRLYYWGATGTQGNTHLYDITANYSVIPEPSTLGMLALCSLGLLARRRR